MRQSPHSRALCLLALSTVVLFFARGGYAVIPSRYSCANEEFHCTDTYSYYETAQARILDDPMLVGVGPVACDRQCSHWLDYGKWENKVGSECHDLQFDPEYYLNEHADVRAHLGLHIEGYGVHKSVSDPMLNEWNFQAACSHYRWTGLAERRPASPCDFEDFDCHTYLANNQDVAHMVGNSCSKACKHWLYRGRAQLRVASKCHDEPFDCGYYYAQNEWGPMASAHAYGVGPLGIGRHCNALCEHYLEQKAIGSPPQAMSCSSDAFECSEYKALYPSVAEEAAESAKVSHASPVREYVNRRVTWHDATRYCATKGMRLCNSWEVCPYGRGSSPFGGTVSSPVYGNLAKDQWTPVGEEADRWVQVSHNSGPCVIHEVDFGFKLPTSRSRIGQLYKGWIYCCPHPSPSAYIATTPDRLAPLSEHLQPHSNVHQQYIRPEDMSWPVAQANCAAQGRRLCTYSEICPTGPATEPIFGVFMSPDPRLYGGPEAEMHTDQWTPYLHPSGEERWLQVGVRGGSIGDTCGDHQDSYGALWKNVGDFAPWAGSQYCCDGPVPFDQQVVSESSQLKRAGLLNALVYKEAELECNARSQRLCLIEEICPNGVPFGGARSTDVWAPARDRYNEWVQVGQHSGGTCTSHLDTYGPPAWGVSKDLPRSHGVQLHCCQRRMYEPSHDNQVTVRRYNNELGQQGTWTDAADKCIAKGQRLCLHSELCGGSEIAPGAQTADLYRDPNDMWVPVSGRFNKWVQVGNHPNFGWCQKHPHHPHDLTDFSNPPWGMDSASAHPWRGHLYCCEDSQVQDDMKGFTALPVKERWTQPVALKPWYNLALPPPHTFSWTSARAMCNGMGLDLCTRRKICENGLPFNGVIHKDTWAPTLDGPEKWVQVGLRDDEDQYPPCGAIIDRSTHADFLTENYPVAYKTHVYCCTWDHEVQADHGKLLADHFGSPSCAAACDTFLGHSASAEILRTGRAGSEADCAETAFDCEYYRSIVAQQDEEAAALSCDNLCAVYLRNGARQGSTCEDSYAFNCDFVRNEVMGDPSATCSDACSFFLSNPTALGHPITLVTAFDCEAYVLSMLPEEQALYGGRCGDAATHWMQKYGQSPVALHPPATSVCTPDLFDCRAYLTRYPDAASYASTNCDLACTHYQDALVSGEKPFAVAAPDEGTAVQCDDGRLLLVCNRELTEIAAESGVLDELSMEEVRFTTLGAIEQSDALALFRAMCAATPQRFVTTTAEAGVMAGEQCVRVSPATVPRAPPPPAPTPTPLPVTSSQCETVGYNLAAGHYTSWLCVDAPPEDLTSCPYRPLDEAAVSAVPAFVEHGVDYVLNHLFLGLKKPAWLASIHSALPGAAPAIQIATGDYIANVAGEELPVEQNTTYVYVSMGNTGLSLELIADAFAVVLPDATEENADFAFIISACDSTESDWAFQIKGGAGIPIFPPFKLTGLGFSHSGNWETETALELWKGNGSPFDPEQADDAWGTYQLSGVHLWLALEASANYGIFGEGDVHFRFISPAVTSFLARSVTHYEWVTNGVGGVAFELAAINTAIELEFAEWSGYGLVTALDNFCQFGGTLTNNPFHSTPLAPYFQGLALEHVLQFSARPCPYAPISARSVSQRASGVLYSFFLESSLGPFRAGWAWKLQAAPGPVGDKIGVASAQAHAIITAGHEEFANYLNRVAGPVFALLQGSIDALQLLNPVSAASDVLGATESGLDTVSSALSGCGTLCKNCQMPCGSKKRTFWNDIEDAFNSAVDFAEDTANSAVDVAVEGFTWVAGQVCFAGNTVLNVAQSATCDALSTTFQATSVAVNVAQRGVDHMNVIDQGLEELAAQLAAVRDELEVPAVGVDLFAELHMAATASNVGADLHVELGVRLWSSADDFKEYTIGVSHDDTYDDVVKRFVMKYMVKVAIDAVDKIPGLSGVAVSAVTGAVEQAVSDAIAAA